MLPHRAWYIPDNKVHGANMGPSGVYRTQVGPMLVPWSLLSEIMPMLYQILKVMYKQYWFEKYQYTHNWRLIVANAKARINRYGH